MPSLKTHYFFANQLYQKDQARFSFLQKHEDVLYLTAQGPDPFMFFGYAFWRYRQDIKKIRDFASQLHSDKEVIIQKFLCFFEYAKGLKKEDQEVALTAIYGELSHYIVDSYLHPYVFYQTGYVTGVDFATYFYDHGRFESMLDTELEVYYKKRIKAARVVACPYHKLAIISKMYAHCCSQLKSATYLESVEDMYAIEKLLTDRFSIKKGLLFLFGFQRHQARALSHYYHKPRRDTIDYLNTKKLPWRYPDTGEISHASVVELLQEAHQAFADLSFIFTTFKQETLVAALSDKSYDGISYEGDFVYGESIYRT